MLSATQTGGGAKSGYIGNIALGDKKRFSRRAAYQRSRSVGL